MRDPVTGLTDRQLRFATEYQVDRNGTQAAIRAGYTPKGASLAAHRLLRNEKIEKIVATADVERLERVAGSVDWIVDQAVEVVRRAVEGNDATWKRAAVPALALLAKRHPEFREAAAQVNIDARSVNITPERLKELRDLLG